MDAISSLICCHSDDYKRDVNPTQADVDGIILQCVAVVLFLSTYRDDLCEIETCSSEGQDCCQTCFYCMFVVLQNHLVGLVRADCEL